MRALLRGHSYTLCPLCLLCVFAHEYFMCSVAQLSHEHTWGQVGFIYHCLSTLHKWSVSKFWSISVLTVGNLMCLFEVIMKKPHCESVVDTWKPVLPVVNLVWAFCILARIVLNLYFNLSHGATVGLIPLQFLFACYPVAFSNSWWCCKGKLSPVVFSFYLPFHQ